MKVAAVRLYSAVACLISMLLTAWAGAFGRAISAHHWHAFRVLDGVTLLAASEQAANCQSHLLPVFLSWAALLLLTPARHSIAFRVAVAAAGILGFLRLSPPPFLVTTRVTTLSHWLARSGSLPAVPYLVLAITLAYILLTSATGTFGRLDYLHRNARRAPRYAVPSPGFTRKLFAALLILLVLLSVTWAATVVRLVASGADLPGAGMSDGRQGGLAQSTYLLLLAPAAIAIARTADSWKWLIIAVILTAGYSLATGTLRFSWAPEVPVIRRHLAHLGAAWGGNSLWAALFVFTPVAVFGIYLAARLLRTPRTG